MKKMLVLAGLVVLGVISTSYAKQEAFIELQELRAQKVFAHKEEMTSAVRAPAQAVRSDQQVAREEEAKRARLEWQLDSKRH